MAMISRIPLSKRPLDYLWFIFMLVHIPASLAIDMQPLYPAKYVPRLLKAFMAFYLKSSGDPLMRGFVTANPTFGWFRNFVQLEAAFQLPMFIIGAYCLYHGYERVYPLLLIYAASSVTTQIPCFSLFFNYNSLAANATTRIRPEQMMMLMSSYIPFFLAPLGIMVDMAVRLDRKFKALNKVEMTKKLG